MYARSTTIRGNPQSLDEGIAYVRDEVMPFVQEMDGCIGLSMLADRDTGRCIVTTAWADEQAIRASADRVRSSRDRAAESFGGRPEVQEWEIAVLHRVRPAEPGACTRVTWGQADGGRLDETLETVRMTLLPKVEELPGFCSISVLVERQSGRVATAVTYESRDALERSQQDASALRQQYADTMHMQITEVAEFELALAHLRVPETV